MPLKSPRDKQKLIERRQLYRALQELPSPHFEEIIFALNPPAGIVSSSQTAQGNRTSELLGWAEGTGGCSLDAIYDLLEDYIPDFERPKVPKSKIPAAAASRVFISYKRDIVPDEAVAVSLYEELSKTFDIQIDQSMLPFIETVTVTSIAPGNSMERSFLNGNSSRDAFLSQHCCDSGCSNSAAQQSYPSSYTLRAGTNSNNSSR